MEVSTSVSSLSEAKSLMLTAGTVDKERSLSPVKSLVDTDGWMGEFCTVLSKERVSVWGKEESCDEDGDPSSEIEDSGEDCRLEIRAPISELLRAERGCFSRMRSRATLRNSSPSRAVSSLGNLFNLLFLTPVGRIVGTSD